MCHLHLYSRYSIDNCIFIFMVVWKEMHTIQSVEQPELFDMHWGFLRELKNKLYFIHCPWPGRVWMRIIPWCKWRLLVSHGISTRRYYTVISLKYSSCNCQAGRAEAAQISMTKSQQGISGAKWSNYKMRQGKPWWPAQTKFVLEK